MAGASAEAIKRYADELRTIHSSGHAREHAYRPALHRLMESFPDTQAINDPKRSAHGNPDFVFLRDSNRSIVRGYAETKDITVHLDKEEGSEQMRRYVGYDKLILTNYLDFRFYRAGTKYKTITIGQLSRDTVTFDHVSFGALTAE